MPTVEWNYTKLADAYLKRAEYADTAIDAMLSTAGCKEGALVCDIGAGTGNLTVPLLKRKLKVNAVEPNDAMRAHGITRSAHYPGVQWFVGTGEETGQKSGVFDLVTFGSSFNVTDRSKALQETNRLLKPRGWFACMWNHRDLSDPLQKAIEAWIVSQVPSYGYGTRREDQTQVINDSGLFEEVRKFEGTISVQQTKQDCIEAWRSHATLHRQAGENFATVIEGIERIVNAVPAPTIEVPYVTRIWLAQKIATA